MARLPRLSIPGWPHVLRQSGHNRQPVCLDEADAAQFRDWLADAARIHGVAIHAYALRATELRMLLTPATDAAALGRMMQSLGRRYGAYFNRRHGRTGGLWEGRFRATVIEPERHLLEAMVWVEAWGEQPFSGACSQAHHMGQKQDTMVSDPAQYWALGNTPFERELAYRLCLGHALAPVVAQRLEVAVQQGWPLGSPAFVSALAGVTERRLAPLPKGRRVAASAEIANDTGESVKPVPN